MSWEPEVALDAALRAALTARKNLVYVCPPAWWALFPLLRGIPETGHARPHTVFLVPDRSSAAEGADLCTPIAPLGPLHAATGPSRTARLLSAGAVASLLTTPPDLLGLVARSQLDLTAVTRIAICWPEWQAELGQSSHLDTILAEAGSAQRLVVTADAVAIADFLERHARRAPTQIISIPPDDPHGDVRYALTSHARLLQTARDVLDVSDPASAFLWDPIASRHAEWQRAITDPWVRLGDDPDGEHVQLAIAVALPSAEALAALCARADAVVVLARPPELTYLRALVARVHPLVLPSEADGARDRAAQFRETIRARLRASVPDAELLRLAPLFDEFDPALVAAAVVAGADALAPTPTPTEEPSAFVRIRMTGGSRDRIRTADVVGALINAVGLPKRQIGRVDIRDTYSLIEIQAEAAHKARLGLDGLVLRGKKVAARLDRR